MYTITYTTTTTTNKMAKCYTKNNHIYHFIMTALQIRLSSQYCTESVLQIQLLDWQECERHQYLVNFSLQEDAPLLLKWSITGIV